MPAVLLIIGVLVVGGIGAMLLFPTEDQAAEPEPAARVENVTQSEAEITIVSDDDDDASETTGVIETVTEETPTESESATTDSDATYTDGTYTSEISYAVPSGNEEPATFTLTLENDMVVAVNSEFEGIVGTSRLRQARFVEAYQTEVVGKDIDDLDLVAVGGSSLTTGAFMEAVADVKVQAAS